MLKDTVEKRFDLVFLILFCILVVGIPLVFTSYTRSVFEVNKLLLLRIITLITMGTWLFKYILFKDNNQENEADKSISILGFRWKKIGLEYAVIAWLVVNIISTLFSQNLRLSIIGAYDRWEGLITVTNYMVLFYMFAKLVRKKVQFHWIIGAIIASTLFSAIYGVCQSFGFDFMNWSVDPSKRIFACINNPVHFCAYVAMVVPLGLSLLLFLSTKYQGQNIKPIFKYLKWGIFVATAVIYYSQFLSFSRATWMGFVGAMALFYLMTTNSLDKENEKSFIWDFMLTGVAIASFFMVAIFKIHMKSTVLGYIISILIGGYLFHSLKIAQKQYGEKGDFETHDLLLSLLSVLLVFFNYVVDLSAFFSPVVYISLHAAMTIYFVLLSLRVSGPIKGFLSRIVIILIFTKLQYVSLSLTSIALYFSLLISYYYLGLKGNTALIREKKFWLISYLFIFGTIIILPTLPDYAQQIFKTSNVGQLKATQNAKHRLNTYSRDAIQGTARTSMWKSALPWIKDYWLIGTGPDTVKYMYPKYRRPEYGILEGGHNFTPDRLHNEYINTLATRGILGFITYYGLFILGWVFLMLKGYLRFGSNPFNYLAAGLMSSAAIYMGQMMFNFGVVATLVLFYVCMGLGLALISHKDFDHA